MSSFLLYLEGRRRSLRSSEGRHTTRIAMWGVIWKTSWNRQLLCEAEECQVECEEVVEVTKQVAEKDMADTLALTGKCGASCGTGLCKTMVIHTEFHLIVFPSEEDRAWFVFLADHIFSGVHYESYIFQAVSKLILCWHISKLAKFLLRPRWGVQNEGKVRRQEHYFITHLRRESWKKKHRGGAVRVTSPLR